MTEYELWAHQKPKRDQLLLWLKEKEFATTSEIRRWGLDHFYGRAERTARDLANEGLIYRLTDQEKRFRGFKTREGVYRADR